MTLLIGTHNRGKVREIAAMMAALPLSVKSLDDFPQITPVDETGSTLEENAILKAKAYGEATGLLTLADDTGLEVRALNGAPGVYSARYAGENCTYDDNNRKLIEALRGLKFEERAATFRSVIAIYEPKTRRAHCVEGRLEGAILDEVRGEKGFGYDPIFFVPAIQKTLAELSLEEKNTISHRALAFGQAHQWLTNFLKQHD